ncbi:MAG: MarR family transcriptional regulator [Leptolyngbya sp. SIO1E4]|nr:MarR family transcriptional regulator [Leptolyngbya sp. SIO1E4]
MDLSQRVEAIRRFNRFYTRKIGLLNNTLLKSPFSLTEARVIYELAHRETATASDLCGELGLDAGYMSRIVRSFQHQTLLDKQPSERDGRQSILRLTPQGRAVFATLNAASTQEIEAMLTRLSEDEQQCLIEAIATVEQLLGQGDRTAAYILRAPRPGDMGWVIQRHGVLYAQEYGWDAQFEALVAEIAVTFIQQYDPKWERCWIAERKGENVGSAFLVKQSEAVAKLRLLLVEPSARGLGLGTCLVQECVNFARQVGYGKVLLWTGKMLHAARHIYEKTGFRLIEEEPQHSFGHDWISETWELDL